MWTCISTGINAQSIERCIMVWFGEDEAVSLFQLSSFVQD